MDQALRFHILPERAGDGPAIEPLLDRTFGPERREKTVYRLREGVAPLPELCFVATDDEGALQASLRFWPIRIEGLPAEPGGGPEAILLGPLAVEPRMQGRGMGRALVRHGLEVARRMKVALCVVVGEPEYYQPYGFEPATPHGLILPGPVEPRRFQVLELIPGAVEQARGAIDRDTRHATRGDISGGAEPGRAVRRA